MANRPAPESGERSPAQSRVFGWIIGVLMLVLGVGTAWQVVTVPELAWRSWTVLAVLCTNAAYNLGRTTRGDDAEKRAVRGYAFGLLGLAVALVTSLVMIIVRSL